MRCMGEGRSVYKILVGKPEGKKPLGRPRHRWEDCIRIIFKKWIEKVWTGFMWFRIVSSGWLLWTL
jgi:hypothetical protein